MKAHWHLEVPFRHLVWWVLSAVCKSICPVSEERSSRFRFFFFCKLGGFQLYSKIEWVVIASIVYVQQNRIPSERMSFKKRYKAATAHCNASNQFQGYLVYREQLPANSIAWEGYKLIRYVANERFVVFIWNPWMLHRHCFCVEVRLHFHVLPPKASEASFQSLISVFGEIFVCVCFWIVLDTSSRFLNMYSIMSKYLSSGWNS